MRYNNKNVILPEPWVQPGPANNEIWYTSTDGNVVTPYRTSALPTIVSNTYSDGKGVFKFATDVTNIGFYAFQYTRTFVSVILPNSVTNISEKAFYNCYISSIIIGNSVKSIGYMAFSSLIGDKFTQLTIPNSVTSIEDKAFYNCSALTSISYTGTIAQYRAISKGTNWHQNVPATVVHCTDGDAPI